MFIKKILFFLLCIFFISYGMEKKEKHNKKPWRPFSLFYTNAPKYKDSKTIFRSISNPSPMLEHRRQQRQEKSQPLLFSEHRTMEIINTELKQQGCSKVIFISSLFVAGVHDVDAKIYIYDIEKPLRKPAGVIPYIIPINCMICINEQLLIALDMSCDLLVWDITPIIARQVDIITHPLKQFLFGNFLCSCLGDHSLLSDQLSQMRHESSGVIFCTCFIKCQLKKQLRKITAVVDLYTDQVTNIIAEM